VKSARYWTKRISAEQVRETAMPARNSVDVVNRRRAASPRTRIDTRPAPAKLHAPMAVRPSAVGPAPSTH